MICMKFGFDYNYPEHYLLLSCPFERCLSYTVFFNLKMMNL